MHLFNELLKYTCLKQESFHFPYCYGRNIKRAVGQQTYSCKWNVFYSTNPTKHACGVDGCMLVVSGWAGVCVERMCITMSRSCWFHVVLYPTPPPGVANDQLASPVLPAAPVWPLQKLQGTQGVVTPIHSIYHLNPTGWKPSPHIVTDDYQSTLKFFDIRTTLYTEHRYRYTNHLLVRLRAPDAWGRVMLFIVQQISGAKTAMHALVLVLSLFH